MKATSSELLMRNFNDIFIELDAVKRAALLGESYTEDCVWVHPGGRISVMNEAFGEDVLPWWDSAFRHREIQ
jgi:hypothetical protein